MVSMLESGVSQGLERIGCCPGATTPSSYPLRPTITLMREAMASMREWQGQVRLIPMSVVQRIVAVIMLLAFLPTSIAAALPLVYCIGADGHRAVEYHLICAEHNHAAPSATTEAADQHSRCIDLKLTPDAQPARGDVKIGVFSGNSSAEPPIKALLVTGAYAGAGPPRTRLRYFARRACSVSIDYLAAHRTVVLTI